MGLGMEQAEVLRIKLIYCLTVQSGLNLVAEKIPPNSLQVCASAVLIQLAPWVWGLCLGLHYFNGLVH